MGFVGEGALLFAGGATSCNTSNASSASATSAAFTEAVDEGSLPSSS
jgi:hypothetical protein